MGVSSSAGPDRRRSGRRSVRFTFTSMVTVPVVCLLLAWAVAVSAVLVSSLAGHGVFPRNHRELAGVALVVAAGMIVVIAALILTRSFARRVSRDITGLAATARRLAGEDLPQAVEPKITEVADAVAAITSLQRTAVAAASAEAGLRDGLRRVFVSLGRRNQSLLHRQLRLIDALEQKASSPAALGDLFTLDHLTTRMRRHAESLTILSGATAGRTWSEPVPVIDVIRGAVAEVEDYKRVMVYAGTEEAVTGPAVADMIHLLAELIENATLFSPSTSRVEVRTERVANGFAVEIDDRGLGIAADQLSEINEQLATPPGFDMANADRLGLFVAGRLAARHGVRVLLRPSPFGGTTAIVLLPNSIVVPAPEVQATAPPSAQAVTGRPARLGVLSAEAPAAAVGPASLERPPAAAQPETPPQAATRAGEPATTYRGLPRRIRQASLSPHLRDRPPAAARTPAAEPGPAPAGIREPEEARRLAASLQDGWQRGRLADLPDTPPVSTTETAGRQDPVAPPSEEGE